jgi:serine phosphatase RsbU (regulator of sigma subunit)
MSGQTTLPKDGGSKLKQKLAQREAELAIINSVQQALASHLEVQAIYDLVGDKICEIFGAQVVMISTYDRETDTIEHRYAIERGERVYAPGKFPIRGFRTQIVQTQQPVLVNTNVAAQAARLKQPTLPGTITPKSWLGVPMMVGDHVTGILSLQDVEQENAFDESDVRFLQALAASMSVALENARLFDETERLLKETEQRAAELQTINNVQEGLAQKLDMASIYELVGEKLRQIFQQADLSIGVYDPETSQFSAPYLIENGKRLTFKPFKVKGEGFIAHLLHNPRSLLINENMEQAGLQYQNVDVTGKGLPKSALYVPLTMGGSMRGAIVLENMQKEHAFSESDVRLLETLANSISVALENAYLWEQENLYRKALEREFEIGREIQAGFLPDTLPQPKGWEIVASLKSAHEVAGDFYDVFELTGGKIGLVIADVCDKGLGAALFMTLFRSLIRMVSSIDYFSPAGSIGRISSAIRLQNAISLTNQYIEEIHGDMCMFATIFFGILDTHTGVLTYINGGHLPPMLINKHGVKESLVRTGPAVGAMADADYAIREVVIEQGDTFFAYTDGLTDTANLAGEIFSTKELIPLFVGDQTLSLLLAQIQKQIENYSAGAQQIDDITMLAVRRNKKNK